MQTISLKKPPPRLPKSFAANVGCWTIVHRFFQFAMAFLIYPIVHSFGEAVGLAICWLLLLPIMLADYLYPLANFDPVRVFMFPTALFYGLIVAAVSTYRRRRQSIGPLRPN